MCGVAACDVHLVFARMQTIGLISLSDKLVKVHQPGSAAPPLPISDNDLAMFRTYEILETLLHRVNAFEREARKFMLSLIRVGYRLLPHIRTNCRCKDRWQEAKKCNDKSAMLSWAKSFKIARMHAEKNLSKRNNLMYMLMSVDEAHSNNNVLAAIQETAQVQDILVTFV